MAFNTFQVIGFDNCYFLDILLYIKKFLNIESLKNYKLSSVLEYYFGKE